MRSNGTQRGDKFDHKAPHNIGVDITTADATARYRLDLNITGQGAHVIPKD